MTMLALLHRCLYTHKFIFPQHNQNLNDATMIEQDSSRIRTINSTPEFETLMLFGMTKHGLTQDADKDISQ